MKSLKIEFQVACSSEHAFRVWTDNTSMWWPLDHTRSAAPGLTVTFEPRAGGRIFERTPAGEEFDWGEVTTWEPPRRVAYLWYIASDRRDATEVEITFVDRDDVTKVTIVHRGWERLGEKGAELRSRNRQGWAGLLPHYEKACLPASD